VSAEARPNGRPTLIDLGVIDDRDFAGLSVRAYLGIGFLGVLASVLVALAPGSFPDMHPIPIAGATFLIFVVAGVFAWRPALVPARRVTLLLWVSTIALGAVMYLAGEAAYPYLVVMAVWVSASFPFMTRRQAFGNLGLAFVVFAVVLAIQPGHWDAVVEWQVAVGTVAIAAGVVEWVVSRISSLAVAERDTRQQLEQANVRLEEVNRQKRAFLATTSHELRTPLNAIIGFSEVLGQELYGSLNPRQFEYVDDIRTSGQHLLGLIGDVLDVRKVESGRLELDVSAFDIRELLSAVASLFREEASRRRITLELVAPPLGTVEGDEGRVRQVVVNLLANALKFTPEGGRVSVMARTTASGVEVDVNDTGPGIAVADQERIFEAFEQAEHCPAAGTGLGLPLARRLVEAHGQRLVVRSRTGEGSTFTFSLDRRLPATVVPRPEARAGSPDTDEARRQNTRVVTTVSLAGSVLGLVALGTLALRGHKAPGGPSSAIIWLFVPAITVGLLLRARPTLLSARRFVATYFLFIAIVTAGLHFAGPVLGATASGFYVWGVLGAFLLLPPRHALALLGVTSVAFAGVLATQPGNPLPVMRWALVMGTCLGTGLMMAWLVEKLHALAAAEQAARLDVERSWMELEQVSRHKSEFLANMSHELRTPLNAIIGFADVLREELFGALNAKQAEYLTDIVEAGQQLLGLINDILDLAKAEAGRIDLDLDEVLLADLVRAAVADFEAVAAHRGVRFDVNVDGAGVVQADPARLARVVANLLSNAVKFSPDGGCIHVDARGDGDDVVVAVRDEGPGIAPSDQVRIFEEFQQLAPTGGAIPGAGLGLALARTFVELHRGRLEVESEHGCGSTFRVAVPRSHHLVEQS
jgi:signal transduction histidine kinase